MNKNVSALISSLFVLSLAFLGTRGQAHAATDNDKNLSSISAKFCNDTKGVTETLSLTASPGEEKDICIEFDNQGNVDVPMQINFVDGAFTSNTNQQSCMRETDTEKFGQFVTGYDTIVNVPAGEKKQITAKVKFSKNKVGKILWCLTYRPAATDNKTYEGMSVIVRKARIISIFVAGNLTMDLQYQLPENPEYLTKNDKMMITQNSDGGVNIGVGFYNAGDLEENITVKGSMKDTFGKVVTLGETVKTILASKKDIVAYNIPQLARYKMWFTVDLEITHQPKIDGIEAQYIPESFKTAKVDNLSITFFIFPRWIVILLGILIAALIIGKLLARRARKHHEQKAAELAEFNRWKEEHEHDAAPVAPSVVAPSVAPTASVPPVAPAAPTPVTQPVQSAPLMEQAPAPVAPTAPITSAELPQEQTPPPAQDA